MTAPAQTSNAPSAAPSLGQAIEKMDKLKELLAAASATGSDARRGLPNARDGEDSMSSRGYSFIKLFQIMSGKTTEKEAKVEIDFHNRFLKLYQDHGGYDRAVPNSILAPVSAEFMPSNCRSDREFASEVRACVKAGTIGADPREIAAIRKSLGVSKALSWQDETQLGALVAPPIMGELIDILRNKEVLMAAGARVMGMPPNGRMVWPRQTGASTAYYIGESQAITDSNPTTGDVTLQAKKLATLVKIPNELFRYSSVSVEAFIRDDMMRVLSLRMDKELLEGVGSSVAPKGLINYAGITSHTSLGTPADGNSGYPLQPEDILQMIAKVEEKNAEFKAWIMRPLMWAYIANKRADAVTTGDGKGPFMFNVWRQFEDATGATQALSGYPIVKSTQISNARTRGSGSTFTYILGGDFSDYLMAIAPTIEFASTTQGDTSFAQDQTWLRAILPHDGAVRREASFVLCDSLTSV